MSSLHFFTSLIFDLENGTANVYGQYSLNPSWGPVYGDAVLRLHAA